MAMTMSGEVQLPASREAVWAKLNDAETLKACIPGCESLNMLSPTEFEAVAVNKIGPVKAQVQRQGYALRPRSAERIQDFRAGRRRRCRIRQGRRRGQAHRQGWRHAAQLQCRGADRRQARATRPAPGQWRGQKTRRRFFREIRGRCQGRLTQTKARPCTSHLGSTRDAFFQVRKSAKADLRRALLSVRVCLTGRDARCRHSR